MKLVQFGAGNIGRAFIGQIFSRAGWEVVFVDINQQLVKLLNERRSYMVVTKQEGRPEKKRRIGPIRAVDGLDEDAAAAELADADIAATSVGKNALPKLLPVIAKGLAKRFKNRQYTPSSGGSMLNCPLDIIIAENDREAPALFRSILSAGLGPEYPLDRLVGLVETSVGKMVPLMKAADLAEDPLQLFTEEYETLIVDKHAFLRPMPEIPELEPADPIAAYVDRKLFIHNLGHAAAGYLGYKAFLKWNNSLSLPSFTIPEALALPHVEENVRKAMNQAADALVLEYPQSRYSGSYSREDLAAHIEDLLFRFKDRALGEQVYRMGRDIRRKLAREDRITAVMLLCARHRLPFDAIAKVYRAAPYFAVPSEDGQLFPADKEFRKEFKLESPAEESYVAKLEHILAEVSALDSSRSEDLLVIKQVTGRL